MTKDTAEILAKYIIRPFIICVACIIIFSLFFNKTSKVVMDLNSKPMSVYTNYTYVVNVHTTNDIIGGSEWLFQQ